MSPASFTELGVSPSAAAALRTGGIVAPTPIQSESIPALLQGRDLLGQAPTGSGKTLAFALPIIQRCHAKTAGVQALVLVPTRELASQVAGVFKEVVRNHEVDLVLLHGGRSLLPERQALQRGAQVVVGTPGRTLDHLRQSSLDLSHLRILVLDEADEMLDRGFAPDVERIIARTPGSRQTVLFSATIPEWVSATAAKHLRNPLTVRLDAARDEQPDIDHVVYQMEPGVKFEALTRLLDQRASSILVFGRTKHGVKKLAKQLAARGYPVGALQGNLAQGARERAIAAFRSGELPILCATNVAARGLDIDGIGQVVNYELPESAELFTHRVGRTGRMGRKGEAITFVTPDDEPKLRQIEKRLGRRLVRHGEFPTPRIPAAPTRPVFHRASPVSRPKASPRRYA